MQTKLKRLQHFAIQQQVCAGLTAVGTPAALEFLTTLTSLLWQPDTAGDSGHWQLEPDDGIKPQLRGRTLTFQVPQQGTKSPNLDSTEEGREGMGR